MFGYYIDLALRSLKRSPILTALMVLAIGLGIGASMTMITVLHVMTADPLPAKSARLFYPQIDPMGKEGYTRGDAPPDQMTWIDAMNLLHARRGSHQVAMTGGQVTVRPLQGKSRAFYAAARYASADFFVMFDVPFFRGHGWTSADDEKQARVVVISRELADKLYGADHAAGQELRLGKDAFRVIGVVDHWQPTPHFYDLTQGDYAKTEQVFMPLETAMALKQPTQGNVMCWDDGGTSSGDMRKANACVWMQFWVQLDTPAAVDDYRTFLVHYSQEQKTLGRFQRASNTRLNNLMGWLDVNHVVPGSVQLQALLALSFMLVCLVNTVALLLVKFLRRSGELSVRRAMGASKRSVFAQLLVEASIIGVSGGLAGLLLAGAGLWLVRQQPVEYAALAHLDLPMLSSTVVLAVVATTLAAIFPAWRACHLPPAVALKLQ
jgi:putative ABC transport system permease protein